MAQTAYRTRKGNPWELVPQEHRVRWHPAPIFLITNPKSRRTRRRRINRRRSKK